MRDVDIVIVSYGTCELTASAVESVLEDPEAAHVLVVDNDSPDGSAQHLARRFAGTRAEVVPLPENRGFGAACNEGARRASAPYLFFLNSDARAHPDCLGRLRARLESEPDVGMVAPAVYQADGTTLQSDAQGDLPTPAAILLRRTRRPTWALEPGWVSGVAFMVRRREFLDLGGFDPAFFLYYEDVELCRRYGAAGRRIVRELQAGVTHLGGRSQRSSAEQKADYDRSQDRYLELRGAPPVQRRLIRLLRGMHRHLARRGTR